MLANVKSCAVIGLDGVVVDVEVDTRQGLPGVVIVGLDGAENISPNHLAEALQYRAKQVM